MSIIRPRDGERLPDRDEWVANMEAALHGNAVGTEADSWRALREDVRSLAPAMSREFAEDLEADLQRGMRPAVPSKPTPASTANPRRRRIRVRLGRLAPSLLGYRVAVLGGAAFVALALVAVLLVAGPSAPRPSVANAPSGAARVPDLGVEHSSPRTKSPYMSGKFSGVIPDRRKRPRGPAPGRPRLRRLRRRAFSSSERR